MTKSAKFSIQGGDRQSGFIMLDDVCSVIWSNMALTPAYWAETYHQVFVNNNGVGVALVLVLGLVFV